MALAIVEVRGRWLAVEFENETDAESWVHHQGLGTQHGRALRQAGQRVGSTVTGDIFTVSEVVTPEAAEQIQAGE